MLRKLQDLNQPQIEVLDLLLGIKEEEKMSNKKLASRRALKARRAIERRMEEKELQANISDGWFDE